MELENTKHFKYIAVSISYNKFTIDDKVIEHRLGSVIGSFSQQRTLIQNQNIGLKTRVMFLNSEARSRLSYGCLKWYERRSEISKVSTV